MISPFDRLGLPWNLVLSVVAMIVASALILDAGWMAALLRRGGLQSAPPPLFRAPIRIEGRWRRAAYLAFAVFGLAPLMMQPMTGVWRLLVWPAGPILIAGLVAAIALTLVAEGLGWSLAGTVGGLAIVALMGAPYALAGPAGWTRYAVIVGMAGAILALLYAAALLRTAILAYRPRSLARAVARLVLDGAVAFGVMVTLFWPWLEASAG